MVERWTEDVVRFLFVVGFCWKVGVECTLVCVVDSLSINFVRLTGYG